MVIMVASCALVTAENIPYHQTDFPPEEFKARWEVVFHKIGDHAVAILQGSPRTNGFIFPRQTNDFYYTCGIETPGSYILLDGRSHKVTLYLPARDARLDAVEPELVGPEHALFHVVRVVVDETRDHRPSVQIDPPGAAGELIDLLIGTDRDNPVALDRDRLRDAEAIVDGDDLPVGQHRVGHGLLRMDERDGRCDEERRHGQDRIPGSLHDDSPVRP